MIYTLDDVAATLNGVVPYDWKSFLTQRTTELADHAPLNGITKGGYSLVYTDQPTKVSQQGARTRGADFTYSIGMGLDPQGAVTGVLWNGPAYKAGLTVGAQVLAVNDHAYSGDALKEAITAAKGSGAGIRLVVKHGDQVKPVLLDYRGGLRYPHLVKTGTGDGGLDRLLAPR